MAAPVGARAAVADHSGFAEFCRREHPRLVALLSLYMGSVDDAEELAQEALVRACVRWAAVDAMGEGARRWLSTVALNLARSRMRRAALWRRAEPRLATPAHAEAADAAAAHAVRRAVAALPEKMRRVIVLRYFADLSVREVAEAVGCPEGTVKNLTHQAVARLRASGLEVDDA